MVKKLKSILRPIPWSLALKASIFGASWLIFPFWAFLLIAFYFYLSPFFQPVKFALHFIVLLFFIATTPLGFWAAIFFSIVLYLLLGLKDFFFLDKRSAYEILLFLFVIMFTFRFYSYFETWSGIFSVFYIVAFGFLFFLLSHGLWGFLPISSEYAQKGSLWASLFMLSFILCQLIFAVMLLPLNFLYQTAFFFLSAAIITESVFDYLCGSLTSRRLLTNFSIFLVFIVVILGFAPWSL